MTPLDWAGGYFLVGTALAGFDWLLTRRRVYLRGAIEKATLLWIFVWPLMLLGLLGLAVLILLHDLAWWMRWRR